MKKAIAYAAAFALAFAQPYTLTGTALADEVQDTDSLSAEINVNEKTNDFTVSCSDSVSDENGNISTYIQFENTLPCTNGIFTVNYDSEMLEFKGGEACGILGNAVYEINETEPGTVIFTFISKTTVTSEGNAVKLDFRGIQRGSSRINITVNELSEVDASGEINELPATTALATLSVETAEVYAEFEVNESAEPYTVTVSLSENPGFTNCVLTVHYTADALKFESLSFCDENSGIIADYNETEPGTVKIVFISDKEITATGDLINLHFSAADTGSSTVCVEADELVNISASGDEISVPWKVNSAAEMGCANIFINEGPNGKSAVILLFSTGNVTNGVFTVKYNPEVLKFESGEVLEGFQGVMADFNETEPGVIKAVFISETEIADGGDFMQLNFSEIKSGTCEITAEATEFIRTDADGISHDIKCFPAKNYIHCEPYEDGPVSDGGTNIEYDIDEDGLIASSDLLTLINMIENPDEISMAGDINGDGKVDSKDVLSLVKLLLK